MPDAGAPDSRSAGEGPRAAPRASAPHQAGPVESVSVGGVPVDAGPVESVSVGGVPAPSGSVLPATSSALAGEVSEDSAIHLVLRPTADDDTIEGVVEQDDTGPRAFHGWLELTSLLDRARPRHGEPLPTAGLSGTISSAADPASLTPTVPVADLSTPRPREDS